ncbi:MAG: mannose-1-phosphate guanylyltransferase/mannose-6-phosphate isomerase [Magnetococcales bacterium]|nr:mannose-1-phosphate guanylyltransferase/mannose-6-phosphate isomerase [Magnetococcales bacterium]
MVIIPVVLSGGSGTRLWPLSRGEFPKQFHPLASERSLFQETLLRLRGLTAATAPMLICNDKHRFLATEQAHKIGVSLSAILLEPVGRNTAPAAACAALHSTAHHQSDSLLLLLPADHVIADVERFHQVVMQGAQAAMQGHLVTFGIVPDRPDSGFGYIQRGERWQEAGYFIRRFVEKPDTERAEQYLAAGDYYWNSGMFLFRADIYLAELERLAPGIVQHCRQAMAQARCDLDFLRLDSAAFSACPSDSIDCAVMEKSDHGLVLPLEVGWNDVGSWSALWQIGDHDAQGNVLHGDVVATDSNGCYLRAEHRLLATVGLHDHVVVETADAVIVAPRDRVQDIRHVVAALQTAGRNEPLHHRRVYRPWGFYEVIHTADRFQVKRIVVHVGASLSLQMHHHRAEHWVVVHGTAQVTRGQETLLLTEDQSAYIPTGVAHRLANPGKIPLELIEVQSGSYLGEDDIVRFEDSYGR